MNVICPQCGESPVLDDYDYCKSCLLSNARADDAWREHMVPTSPDSTPTTSPTTPDSPTPDDIRFTPHTYVSHGNRWRTCQMCGIGANAAIHQSPIGPDGRCAGKWHADTLCRCRVGGAHTCGPGTCRFCADPDAR